ncbi:UDP-N-acetylmuramoyl-L-alanine--D-glutamate ligase [Brumicola pallidula]|uniref:UDP-N-acetylmuramoyl-L-alanine--D-glutamate ligase n=1 Tax=Brumicola pallidula TaxID=56807 RepID=UPI001FD5626E|nr:UDP-N-acetylmuramoyl-L-alanine--D-glutamate ligase [Glaciecola pallidula]
MANQSIAVIGYGITGRACVRFLLSQQATVCVFDRDVNIQETVKSDTNVKAAVFEPDMSLSSFSIVVVSPGVSPHLPCFATYREQGGVLIGDIELFAWFNKTPLIGITGSNGKTTVTDMLGKVLNSAGLHVELAGNYGKCAVDLLLEQAHTATPAMDIVVLELSSYQLEMTESLQLEFATILNITEDHLDRHGSFEAYKAAKQRIFNMAKNIVVCRDEVFSYPLAMELNEVGITNMSTRICAEVGLLNSLTGYSVGEILVSDSLSNSSIDSRSSHLAQSIAEPCIQFNGSALVALSDLHLKGSHNYINIMIVLAICDQLSLDRQLTIKAICDYKGLPHRFETIRVSTLEVAGKASTITWINDSKSTNVGACQAALACFTKSDDYLVLIAGGDAKGVDLSPLKKIIDSQVNQLIVLGKDAHKFIELIPNAIHVRNLQEAVATSLSLIQKADRANAVVLLSPACASLDMFVNYQDRGNMFASAVNEQVA